MSNNTIFIAIVFGLLFIAGAAGRYAQSQYLAGVMKSEMFILTTAIKANSCFHLELPPTNKGK